MRELFSPLKLFGANVVHFWQQAKFFIIFYTYGFVMWGEIVLFRVLKLKKTFFSGEYII